MKFSLNQFICLSLFGVISWNVAANTKDGRLMEENPLSNLFDQQATEQLFDKAYDYKAKAYGDYAVLFNLCQKEPEHARCGEELEFHKAAYNRAKATHEAIIMAGSEPYQDLKLPAVAYQQLSDELIQLGYLTNAENIRVDQIVTALNQWLADHNLEPTHDIYLLHGYAVSLDALINSHS
ncbi:hypothetical protein [Vibrio agarivorans]|uniref:Uncharacterized protein n=1 Tax=Vibrio agarivorans TaxID=153622 RepID=A0ABT7XZJ2_9VIBR|nr:hypothetical protein [Vibrio agarivorans]MDN2481186.1 hypothetical protein [Vibrio agarivorans]